MAPRGQPASDASGRESPNIGEIEGETLLDELCPGESEGVHVRQTSTIKLVNSADTSMDSLQAFKAKHLGSSYVERVVGTGKLMDTELRVNIDFEHWQLPGEDTSKSIAFPDRSIHHKAIIPTPGL